MRKEIKKNIAVLLTAFMVFGTLPWNSISPGVVFAATGFRHETLNSEDVVLGGNYIEVGISKGGSFGTKNNAPSGFHPSPSAHQTSSGVGLRVDGDGFDAGSDPTTGDFFLPGTPEEGFTVGYKVNSNSVATTTYSNAERNTGDGIQTITTDTTSGDTLSATTSGITGDSNLAIQQNVSFKVNDKFFKTKITYTNNGSNTLYDIRYMRSFDPDQDAALHGAYDTKNCVLENFPQDSRAIVRASGGYTGDSVFFISTDNRARASAPTLGLANRNPYDASVYNVDGSNLKTSELLEDQPIALTFALGNLAPGQSTTFEYYTSLDPDYNSGLSAIMGSLGLKINNGASKTNSLHVTLNLNGSNVSKMCFSNDNLSFTDWEDYAPAKAWTLASGKGTKTVYVKFKDSSNNVSQLNASIDYNNVPIVSNGSISTKYQTTYNFTSADFTQDGKFTDPDGDTLNQIKITNVPVHGVLKLSGNNVSTNQIIAYSNLSNLVYIPNGGYYGADIFKWTASDGSDFSASEASMNITVQAPPPNAPGTFVFPAAGQIVKGGDSINVTWGAVASPQGAAVTYTLDYFNGSTWNNIYTGTSTSYNFANTSDENLSTAKFRVLATDPSGSSIYTLSNTFTIDSQAPTITSIVQTPAAWTSDNIVLTVNAADGVSGLADKAYSFDGGNTWQADNTKTYSENTSGIVVKVKDKSGNIVTYAPIDIAKIDKTLPNAPVINDVENYTDSKWYNSDQTITASFTRTDGCDEKSQYKVNSGDWIDGETVSIADEGNYNVSFRVIDSLGRTGAEQSVKVNIDKTAPTNAKITVEDSSFTKFLNKITFGLFFKETADVSITADSDISGTKKIEYQKVSEESDYKPDGTWTNGSSFSIVPDDKCIIYAKITDNAGNYVIINTDGVVVDSTKPELQLTTDTSGWLKENINVKVTASDVLAGLNEVTYTTDEAVPQTGTAAITDGTGTITLTNEGQYKLTVTAKDNSLNEITKTVDIMIDKSLPVINSIIGNAADWTSNSIKLTVDASDGVSGLADKAYSFDGGNTWQADNTKTYSENTSGIVVKVMDKSGNVVTYAPIDITKIDKTAPTNAPVIANAENYTDSKWYNSDQTITASFTRTDGCDEKLQYKVNSGDWIDGETVSIADEGTYNVSFRVIDSLGRTGAEQSVKVNIDKTAPTNAKITVKDSSFTKFLNKITFGLFFKETADVSITADGNISGINHYEYQVVDTSKGQSYDENGTWKRGDSFSILPQFKGAIYARAVDNAENTSNVINSCGVIVDSVNPTIPMIQATVDSSPYTGEWTAKDILINASDSTALSGINHYEYKAGVDGQWKTMTQESGVSDSVTGNTLKDKILVNEDIATTYYIRAVSNSGTISKEDSIIIKRDSSIPNTNVSINKGTADAWTKNPVTFTVTNTNEKNLAPVSFYVKVGSSDWVKLNVNSYTLNDEINQAVKFKTVTEAGLENICGTSYSVQIDKTNPVISGVEASKSYYIGRLINVSDSWGEIGSSVYTKDGGKEVQFSNGDLISSPGKYNIILTDKAENQAVLSYTIKALPGVSDIKYTEDSKALIEKIRDEFNGHSDLPEPYRTETDNAIKALENRYAELDKEVHYEVRVTNEIPTTEDGLISQKDKILEILHDINGLTKEQQIALKTQIDELNSLITKINTLEAQVANVKTAIKALPAVDKVIKQDAESINSVKTAYDKLNNEQKNLVGKDLVTELNEVVEQLAKVMLYNKPNDVTVTGIDGTKFSIDTYLVVTPITSESNKASVDTAKNKINEAAKTNSDLKKKDLLALYDVSLIRNNVKIEPDGKVQVKIKIPAAYVNRKGLEIIHIADDGTVTMMHAKSNGKYLTFITNHFSQYGIIAKNTCWLGICDALGIYEKDGGVCYDWAFVLGAVIILMGTAIAIVYKKKKRKELES